VNLDAHLACHEARGRVIRKEESAPPVRKDGETSDFTRIESKGPEESCQFFIGNRRSGRQRGEGLGKRAGTVLEYLGPHHIRNEQSGKVG
jgi:hypothetical protein